MNEQEQVMPGNGEVAEQNISAGFADSLDEVNVNNNVSASDNDESNDEIKEDDSIENSDGFGELPEFAKRKLGEVGKKYKSTKSKLDESNEKLRQLQEEVQQYREAMQQYANPQYQNVNQNLQYQQNEDSNLVYDAWNGQYVDKNSPQGQAILVYHQQKAAEQAMKAREQEEASRIEFEKSEAVLMDNFKSSIEESMKKHQDFKDVLTSSKEYISPAVAKLSMMAPNPGEFLYYLAGNQKEMQRLSKLPPLQMARELNRHMVAMEKKNIVSNAPAPIKGVGQERSSGGSFNNFSYEKMKAAGRERAQKWANKR